ncbi:MAG: MoxR family ATPase [Gemmataceae bacterium]|nr:MoxR family ATPase [Gemmataceae bacterium]
MLMEALPVDGTEISGPDLAALDKLREAAASIRAELAKVIVGHEQVIEQILVALFSRGHCLLVGVPGLAKTLLVRTLSDALGLSSNRIQFTPDLMPSDITGTEILQEDRASGKREFRFLPGPIFSNMVLADEINRTPPKTQAALLEAMQEMQVTIGGVRHQLPRPFLVLATQNPIEQEGTYPLPEAQLDRFMFMIRLDYPSEEEEFQIISRTTTGSQPTLTRVLAAEDISRMQELVRRIPASPHVIRYAMEFARRSRPQKQVNGTNGSSNTQDLVGKYVVWGAGPRAGQFLILAGKARAALLGRCLVTREDIRAVAPAVLRHRIILNYHAEADGFAVDHLIEKLAQGIPQA